MRRNRTFNRGEVKVENRWIRIDDKKPEANVRVLFQNKRDGRMYVI